MLVLARCLTIGLLLLTLLGCSHPNLRASKARVEQALYDITPRGTPRTEVLEQAEQRGWDPRPMTRPDAEEAEVGIYLGRYRRWYPGITPLPIFFRTDVGARYFFDRSDHLREIKVNKAIDAL